MFFYKLLNFFTMTEFWDKPAEKSGKVLAAFLEGQPLHCTSICCYWWNGIHPAHIYTAGCEYGYTLHVHTAGCGRVTPCTSILLAVEMYTQHFHRKLLMELFLRYDIIYKYMNIYSYIICKCRNAREKLVRHRHFFR